MKKMKYTLTPLSALIISPRNAMPLYQDLSDFNTEQLPVDELCKDKDKINVIYPFYHYGKYDSRLFIDPHYYVPGSSVKGALGGEKALGRRFMVDDAEVDSEMVVVRNLYKVQNIVSAQEAQSGKGTDERADSANGNESKKVKLDVFMNNVGVEMIKAQSEASQQSTIYGEFFADDLTMAQDILHKAGDITKDKMKQMQDYFKEILALPHDEKLPEQLEETVHRLEILRNESDSNVILLGGYKGLMHSLLLQGHKKMEDKGGVFLDQESGLPHGLVRVEWIEISN